MINEAAVRKYFPNESPIGQRFGSSIEDSGKLEVVGILRDARYNSVREAAPPTMYVPYRQNRPANAMVEVRTAGDPLSALAASGATPSAFERRCIPAGCVAPPSHIPDILGRLALPAWRLAVLGATMELHHGLLGAVREAVRQVDSNLPMMDVSTQLEQVERRFLQERVFAQAYAWFGGLAVLLASIGLFGLMSYSVARRTNEIGIRMALGAQRRDVLRLVMGESMVLVIVGVAIGTAAALAAGRLVASLLFGLAPTDAITMVLEMALMLGVSAIAGYLPARRASRVDPMIALHYE